MPWSFLFMLLEGLLFLPGSGQTPLRSLLIFPLHLPILSPPVRMNLPCSSLPTPFAPGARISSSGVLQARVYMPVSPKSYNSEGHVGDFLLA